MSESHTPAPGSFGLGAPRGDAMGDTPPVPKDLADEGWKCKQSKSHKGHFFYYNPKNDKAYWRLSQCYQNMEWEKRKREKAKSRTNSCDKSALRVFSAILAVVSLVWAYFMAYVSNRDELTIFNISMTTITGLMVIFHTLMAAPFPSSCDCLDKLWFMNIYTPLAFLAWAYEAGLFGFAFAQQNEKIRSKLVFMKWFGGPIFDEFSFSPTFLRFVQRKTGKIVLALAIVLNILQFVALSFATNRRSQLSKEAANLRAMQKAPSMKRKKRDKHNKKNALLNVTDADEDNEANAQKNQYQTLFQQYGITTVGEETPLQDLDSSYSDDDLEAVPH